MQQPQYYKTVRASEKLPEKGKKVHLIFWEGVLGAGSNVGTYIVDDHKGTLEAYEVEWLEPIPIPDAERLREKMQEILDISRDGNIEEPYPLRWKLLPKIATIAREALSQTGDGWVRVEEYDVPMVKHISNSHWITDGKDVYLAYKAGNNWFSKEDKKLPKAFIPTHIKPHTKPSPPQPINP